MREIEQERGGSVRIGEMVLHVHTYIIHTYINMYSLHTQIHTYIEQSIITTTITTAG